jgi:hypothetical protein
LELNKQTCKGNCFIQQVSGKENIRGGGWISSNDVPISTVDYSISEEFAYTFFG